MTPKFKIITTTPCVRCDATKRRLKKHGIPFISVDASGAAEEVEEARAEGATSFPIVIAPDGSWWSDYRIDLIDAWASQAWREERDDREPVG